MIRHGYSTCIACHVSPSGGGALTEYGREISGTALSTWSYTDEQNYLHGALDPKKLPLWVSALGGDVRILYNHVKAPSGNDNRWIEMQEDGEVGVKIKEVRIHAVAGRIVQNGESYGDLRKYYALVPFDEQHYLRVGKFQPELGINIPEHISLVKEAIGAAPLNTAYSAEFSWISPNWSYTVTGFIPTGDRWTDDSDTANADGVTVLKTRGVYQNLSYTFAKTYKIGVSQSVASDIDNQTDVTTAGVFGALGFTHKLYSLFEMDYLQNKFAGMKLEGVAAYVKLAYEIFRGFHVWGLYENSRPDWHHTDTEEDDFGVGIQWFPRPHFDFQVKWTKILTHDVPNDWSDQGFLYLHYYL